MRPHLLDYQLAVLGLRWLWGMRHAAWPSRCALAQGTPAKRILLWRQRSKEPKPCAGLTHKPPCALGVHETTHPQPRSPRRPDPMPPPPRHPRRVDTSQPCCPHTGWR